MTCEYRFENGACIPIRVHTVVISTQHLAKASLEEVRRDVMEQVIKPVIPAQYLDDKTIYHINPCGLFIFGGPMVTPSIVPYSVSFQVVQLDLCSRAMLA